MATLYLADDDDTIRKKVMKMPTDKGPSEKNATKPEYIQNIFLFMNLVSADDTVSQYDEAFNNCTIRYGDMKKQLAEDMIRFIGPVREHVKEILHDEAYLKNIMKAGAEKATSNAEATMEIVRTSMGLRYF